MTERLRAAGDLLGIVVVDHVIVGQSSYSSLSERGLWHEGPTDWTERSARAACTAGELQVSDAGSDLVRTGRNAKHPRRAPQKVRVSLEDEPTPWVLPDQLPLPFLLQLKLPFASSDALSSTLADTAPQAWGELSGGE
jgi:hypothetical protein